MTMRLWGGDSDTGCCSVSDVDDARRCADAAGGRAPRVQPQRGVRPSRRRALRRGARRRDARRTRASSAIGASSSPRSPSRRACSASTPSPPAITPGSAGPTAGSCGSSAVPTGPRTRATWCTCSARATSPARVFPVGDFDKSEVRRLAAELGLRTAAKPDSQDVCFITSTGGRAEFLRRRIPMTPARVVDTAGRPVGTVPAVELVTVGQRKGLGLPGGGPKRFVLEVDRATATVVVGDEDELLDDGLAVGDVTWVDRRDRRRAARADERPRRAAPRGRGLSPRRPGRRVLAGPPAASGRRPERRVLRPFRPLRARWRHRHLTVARPASAQFASAAVSVPDGGAT